MFVSFFNTIYILSLFKQLKSSKQKKNKMISKIKTLENRWYQFIRVYSKTKSASAATKSHNIQESIGRFLCVYKSKIIYCCLKSLPFTFRSRGKYMSVYLNRMMMVSGHTKGLLRNIQWYISIYIYSVNRTHVFYLIDLEYLNNKINYKIQYSYQSYYWR